MKTTKRVFAVLFVAFLLAAGTAVFWFSQELPELYAALTFTPGTESYEVHSGCIGYYHAKKNWPRSLDELKKGLAYAKITPKKIHSLRSLRFLDISDGIRVEYTTSEGMNCHIEITIPATGI
jgi:hypothetical protein